MSFNPTLVRLRREQLERTPRGRREFQSHAGSIEAWDSGEARISWPSVSIPRWFD